MVRLPELEVLESTLETKLLDKRALYFHTNLTDWFDRFSKLLAELRELEPGLFNTVPDRAWEVRGTGSEAYYDRSQVEKLLEYVRLTMAITRQNAPSSDPTEVFVAAGKPFDAWMMLRGILLGAKTELFVEDNYVDASILELLGPLGGKTPIRILTRKMLGDFKTAAQKFGQQDSTLEVRTTDLFHDRFLLVDGVCYMIGASLKDAGTKGFMFLRLAEPRVVTAVESELRSAWDAATVVV